MFAMARTRAGIAIQTRITERDLTQGKLARALKRSQTWVSQSLLDDTERTLKRMWVTDPELLHELLKQLGWDNDTLIEETGLNLGAPYPTPDIRGGEVSLDSPDLRRGTKRIPVFDSAGAGPGWDDGEIIEYIDIPANSVGDNAAYLIRGDSMQPSIPDGSKVIVRLQPQAAPGNVVVCWTPENSMSCKFFDRMEGELFVLTSINPSYRPIWSKDVKIYGPVWEVRTPIPVMNGTH